MADSLSRREFINTFLAQSSSISFFLSDIKYVTTKLIEEGGEGSDPKSEIKVLAEKAKMGIHGFYFAEGLIIFNGNRIYVPNDRTLRK